MAEIVQAPPRSMAGIGSFRDRARLLATLTEAFGVEIPITPGFIEAGAISIACLAPARFLVSGAPDAELPARLARSLGNLAAVTDQSDMWATWNVSGCGARKLLARVVPIDLAPDIFPVGGLALTRAGHLDVRICRVAEASYEIAVTRSTGADLLHALEGASHG